MRTAGCASASPTSRAAYPGADATLQDFAGTSITSSYASLPASTANGEGDRLERTPPRCHPLDLGVVLGSPTGSVRSFKAPSSAGRSSTVLGLQPALDAAALCGSASARSLRSERSSRSPGLDASAGGVKRALFGAPAPAASRSGSGPRRFGPGSLPTRRCPGLGAPTRRVSSSGSRAGLGGACGGGRASLGGGGRASLGGLGGHRLSLGGALAHGQLYRSPRTGGDLGDEGLSAALQQSLAEAPRPPSQATSATFCAPRRGSTSPAAPSLQAADVEAQRAAPCTRTSMRPRPPSPRIKGLVDKFEGGPRLVSSAAARRGA